MIMLSEDLICCDTLIMSIIVLFLAQSFTNIYLGNVNKKVSQLQPPVGEQQKFQNPFVLCDPCHVIIT